MSLAKWANRDIKSKAEADKALDDLRAAIRVGTFDERGLEPPVETSPLTFSKFADVYKQRHVLAKGLALADTIDYRLKPLIERFGDRPISEIRTADIEDFVADWKKPRVVNSLDGRTLSPASINRTLGLLRHMLNWAVGREYLDRTPFRRGTEVLIRLEPRAKRAIGEGDGPFRAQSFKIFSSLGRRFRRHPQGSKLRWADRHRHYVPNRPVHTSRISPHPAPPTIPAAPQARAMLPTWPKAEPTVA